MSTQQEYLPFLSCALLGMLHCLACNATPPEAGVDSVHLRLSPVVAKPMLDAAVGNGDVRTTFPLEPDRTYASVGKPSDSHVGGRMLCDVIHLPVPGPSFSGGAEAFRVERLISKERAVEGQVATRSETFATLVAPQDHRRDDRGADSRETFFFPGGTTWAVIESETRRVDSFSVQLSVGEDVVVLVPAELDADSPAIPMYEWSIFRKGKSGYIYNQPLGYSEALALDAQGLVDLVERLTALDLPSCRRSERKFLGAEPPVRADNPEAAWITRDGLDGPGYITPGTVMRPPDTREDVAARQADAGVE